MHEFHANLPHIIGSTIFVRGTWVPFDSATINRAFELNDEGGEDYRKMFRAPNYDHILETLTNKQTPWRISSSNEAISFPRIGLTKSAKAWFHFVSAKLRPSKHVAIVLRDRALLIYAIGNGFKFNVGHVIESSIMESTNVKALIHPSLITKLCLLARVNMSDSEEKCPPIAYV